MDLGLKDKVVVCMSSASGFGKGIATEFAREGAKVVICTSEAFKAELDQAVVDIEKETGNRPYPYMYDVLNNESIAAMINKVAEDLGGIYGLVNHCPGPKAGTFEALTEADWADGYQKCLYSYTTAIRAALPYMKQGGGGRIVNSTSSSIKQELDNLILSNTFRMGVVGMSKTMAREFGPYNIMVNTMGPAASTPTASSTSTPSAPRRRASRSRSKTPATPRASHRSATRRRTSTPAPWCSSALPRTARSPVRSSASTAP